MSLAMRTIKAIGTPLLTIGSPTSVLAAGLSTLPKFDLGGESLKDFSKADNDNQSRGAA
jgi:hypothetical protein